MKKKVVLGGLIALAAVLVFSSCKMDSDLFAKNYFSVKKDSEGLKIVLADNVKCAMNGGSAFYVDGCPLNIRITNDNILADKREFIYPFTEKGKTYTVTFAANVSTNNGKNTKWVSVKKKCKAGGGTSLDKIINVEAFSKSKMTIDYDGSDFTGAFTFNSTDIIKDRSALSQAYIYMQIMLGEKDWQNTKWQAEIPRIQLLSGSIPKTKSYSVHCDNISTYDWKQYNNQYLANASAIFFFKKHNDTHFQLSEVWTDVKVYK